MKWFFLTLLFSSFAHAGEVTDDIYTRKIQPLFDNRCVACHSCMNAPCQLNLQNYDGFLRGANKLNVYNGSRVDATFPTRLWIDAHSTEEWRSKDFYTVNSSRDPKENLFFQAVLLRTVEKKDPTKIVSASQYCPAKVKELMIGMPYALPALNEAQVETLKTWVQQGAPGPSAQAQQDFASLTPATEKQVREWEKFFNEKDPRHQLVSRYIYEHLFLAHLHFSKEPTEFFRLVRSSSKCQEGVKEIATRRPNDSPGTDKFYYCLAKYPGTMVAKIHIPYELSSEKMKRFEELFYKPEWKVTHLPSYQYQVAENPFTAFTEIPVSARYQFLLDDSRYHIKTFIRGPVCNGSMAVNSIQEQFFVFFINPKSEIMMKSPGFQEQTRQLSILPGMWGSDVSFSNASGFRDELVKNREKYRSLRAEWKKELFPKGYGLQDLWDGDGNNPNAVLTVMRHFDNAVVEQGAVGDLSKTVFILDYPLFERLVYNLVVNYDVYGNVGHQVLTRVYMDMIRMEAEEIFLAFMPATEREPMRKSWYQGFITEMKMQYMFPALNLDTPTAVAYSSPKQAKKEFVQQVLFKYLNKKVRGSLDPINWKTIQVPADLKTGMVLTSVEAQLRKIASIMAEDTTPFARFFPDIAMLSVKNKDGSKKVYSLIHNREHENISWIMAESLRMSPKEDSLIVREGYWGSYPNMFFALDEAQLKNFIAQVLKMKSSDDYEKLVKAYGAFRKNPNFWSVYDDFNEQFRKTDPVNFGYLDLTRYEML